MEALASATEWAARAPVFIVSFIFVLSIVVVFHEFGHFLVARAFGVKVDAFSVGFGKPLLKATDRSGVEWRLGSIPLGGYVKFHGDMNAASAPTSVPPDEDDDREASAPRSMGTAFPVGPGDSRDGVPAAALFQNKPVGVRALVVAAGPVANFVLAMIIFTSVLMGFGTRQMLPVVKEVLPESAAATAGLVPGDRIVAIDGRPMETFAEVRAEIFLSSGETLDLLVERGGRLIELEATPDRADVVDNLGNTTRAGFLGFRPDPQAYRDRRYGLFEGMGEAAGQISSVVSATYRYLSRLVRGKEDASQLGGPVRILKYSGQVAEQSYDAGGGGSGGLRSALINLINLAGYLSVSVGLLNLLPIPVLDGGHLLFYGFEAAGAPPGPRMQAFGHRAGMALLLAFFVFVTFNDVADLLSGVVAR